VLALLLADDFFFAAQDEVTGKSRLGDRAMGLGLAGALLCELVLSGRVAVGRGQLSVVDQTPPPDLAGRSLLGEMIREREVTVVRDWLRYLSRTTFELVSRRLLSEGHVRASAAGRIRRTVVYRPVNMNTAAWPLARLALRATRREPLELNDVALAGLLSATGLDRTLLEGVPADGRQHLTAAVTRLPPPLRALVAETEAAIGDAVLRHRK
jgi:hypothetical protein